MRQASRHSWRIGQTEPVPVVFMAYGNTLQADALKLVAKRLQRSLAVEGELPEERPRRLRGRRWRPDARPRAKDRRGRGGRRLRPDGLRPGAAGRGGGRGAAGRRGLATAWSGRRRSRHGRGRLGRAPEPQRSLFSWAEFMAATPLRRPVAALRPAGCPMWAGFPLALHTGRWCRGRAPGLKRSCRWAGPCRPPRTLVTPGPPCSFRVAAGEEGRLRRPWSPRCGTSVERSLVPCSLMALMR